MHVRSKPKSIAVFFIGGTTVLFGGAAVAASLSPSAARMMPMTAAHAGQSSTTSTPGRASVTSATAVPKATSTSVPRATAQPRAATTTPRTPSKATPSTDAKAPITYTVRRGDTLSGISAWFKLHGYGALYAANAKVIGANPNLIQPGERITIGSHVMKVQGPA